MKRPFNYYLQLDYRENMRAQAAPTTFDDEQEVIPVVVVNTGFPKPSSRQVIKNRTILQSGAGTNTVQLATPTSTLRVFYIGVVYSCNVTAGGATIAIGDASSGTVTATDAATGELFIVQSGTAVANNSNFLPFARECFAGLRCSIVGPTTGNGIAEVYWIEESLV